MSEQISSKYKLENEPDYSYRWWIDPDGNAHHFSDTHFDWAKKYGAKEPIDLLRKGWIRQRANNFEAIGPLSMKKKDIIFMRAKQLNYNRIWVDVIDNMGNFLWKYQIQGQPPETLYEQFDKQNLIEIIIK